jgi:hypothetical protein
VPERPRVRAVPGFPSECRRGNGEHRALGVRHAVAAHLAAGRPGQRATTASTHDQQVIRMAGEAHQDPARRASLHMRLHYRIIRDLSPHCDKRIPKTLAGPIVPDLAQIARRIIPGGGVITLGRRPCDNGYQDRMMGASHNLCVAQCPQAARGATRPGDHATYASHGAAPSSPPSSHVPACAHFGGPAVLASTAAPCTRPRDRPASGWGQPIEHRATGCKPTGTPDADAATEALWPLIAYPRRTNPDLTNVCRPGFPAHLHPCYPQKAGSTEER